MKVSLLTLVYRNPFLEMFEHGLVRSLLWPSNFAALHSHQVDWHIYARDDEIERIDRIVAPTGIKPIFHKILDIHNIADKLDATLTEGMIRAYSDGAAFMPLQPDLIFGDGSIGTLLTLAAENNERCVAMPHPRVNAVSFLQNIPKGCALKNCELVRLAMRNLHPGWLEADLSRDKVNCWHGGVAWREVGKGIYAVTDRLPTVYVARLTSEDIAYFSKNGRKGRWDHEWPTELVKAERQRVIGSSDAAFCVEMTMPDTHQSYVRDKIPNEQDIYRYSLEHHRVNRNTVSIWRAA